MELIEAEIIGLLSNLYETGEAMVWLRSPQPLLADRIPWQMIKDGEGDKVKAMLQAILDGAYL
jgi:hypothetical protein